MKSYSTDLRTIVVEAYNDGEGTFQELAERFKVSQSSVVRWVRQFQRLGHLNPSVAKRGPKPTFDLDNLDILNQLVENSNDAILQEYQQTLAENHSIFVHISTIGRALHRYHLTRKKKSLRASEQEREDVQKERSEFFEKIEGIAPEDIVVLDESGANTALTRAYARSEKGTRAYGNAPRNRGKNITMLGAIGLTGILTAMTVDGAMDGEIFLAFVKQWLAPLLRPGQVVIMDNLSVHKVAGVKEAIEGTGAKLLYLPPYSPDFSPIEPMWSKIKTFLRGIGARARELLQEAISSAFKTVTCKDIEGWFQHCGYRIQ